MKITRRQLRRLIRESNRAQDWRRVGKILTQILQGIKSAFPERIPVDPISMPDLHAKGRKTYPIIDIERGHRSGRFSKGMATDIEIFSHSDNGLNPETQELPAVSVSKGYFDRFGNKGTTKLAVSSDIPWGTGQHYEFEIEDIINDQGQALYELLVKLVGEML